MNTLIWLITALWLPAATAGDYSARIGYPQWQTGERGYTAGVQIEYRLSPTAKEALHKGVPLTWRVILELRHPGPLWDETIYNRELRYTLQFHALLNQYAVETENAGSEMFLTLSAALAFMASISADVAPPGENPNSAPLQLAVKTRFDREALPIPLRPMAYLDHRWFLSSDWYLWSIPK
ncbi:hypothetical protein BJL95_18780 [Methylomonas sp. LWB]|nr:hypothetical protein BJL95_18780 [Methylomonas sp. LWB]